MTSPSTAGHMPGPENLNPPVASNHYKKVELLSSIIHVSIVFCDQNEQRWPCFVWTQGWQDSLQDWH